MHSGYGPFYSLILAIAIMLFESVLWIFAKKSTPLTILKISIIIYSIFITLGAQFVSTSMQTSKTTEVIFNKTDVSGDVKYYREQINKLDNRIDEYIKQQLIFGSEKNRVERENAEAEKEEYKTLLANAESGKTESIKKINSPKTIYAWIAYDFFKIFKSGLSENLIRIILQLFSSFIIALIAPVSFHLIKEVKKTRTFKTDNPCGVESEDTIKEEVVSNSKSPIPQKIKNELNVNRDIKTILDMLLYYYPENEILSAEKAAEYFINVNKSRPEVKAYSKNECSEVLEKVLPFDGEPAHKIREAVLNA